MSQTVAVPDPRPDQRSQTGVRAKLRSTPGGTQLLQVLVFITGLICILIGIALAALPGPLTIPPILLGLYVWSTEFAWAERFLDRAKDSAREAWAKAKARPVLSAFVTLAGLAALGVGVYLVGKFDLVVKGQDLVGL